VSSDWIKSYGQGRVFYISLGVQKAPYSNPLFLQYLLAGIQFALGDLPGDTTPSEK
jgi:type 1 glutamine amidotransferase